MAEIRYVSLEKVGYSPTIVDIVDPPRVSPVATRVGTTQNVSVAFTPAVTGGAATSFLVTTYTLPNAISTSYTGTGSSSPIVVTGLPSEAVYAFRVQGVNASGRGPFSLESNSIGFGSVQHEDDAHDHTNLGDDDHHRIRRTEWHDH